MKKFLLILLVIPFAFGCKKSDRDNDDKVLTSQDVATVNGLVYNAFKLVHQASLTTNGISSSFSDSTNVLGCDTIVNTSGSNLSIRMDFDSGCSYNGYTYSGSIWVNYSGMYDSPSSVASVYLFDFIVNGYTFLDGGFTITNKDTMDGFHNYQLKFNELKIRNNYNQKVFYSGTQNITQLEGDTTATFTDDLFKISGHISGRAFTGNLFSAEILTDLNYSGNCNWISSGEVKITPNTKNSRILDYGSSCDNMATVTVFEITTDIELP